MLARVVTSAVILAAMSAPLLAQAGRPDARRMTCDQVHDLIAQRGFAVLTTGRHTYDRYVAARQFCMPEETTMSVVITTRDTDRCWVYRCQMADYDD